MFQAVFEEMTDDFGPCVILTGKPFPVRNPNVKIVQGPAYERKSHLSRLLSWFRFMAFAFWRMSTVRKLKFVLVTTNPPFLPHLAWLVSIIRGIPFALIIWDIYPDHAVRQGWLRAGGLLAKVWRALNRLSILRASTVVTIGNKMAETLRSQAGQVEIDIIPNWADTNAIKPIPKGSNPFAREHDQDEFLTVLYSGNIGQTHGVEILVEAAARTEDMIEVRFLIIGDGLGLDAARDTAKQLGVGNLQFLPKQTWAGVPYSLAAGDIAVVMQETGSAQLSLPSKTYSHMAAGSAILAFTPKGSDLADLVESESIGIVAESLDAQGLSLAIRRLVSNRAELDGYRQRAREVAEKSYSADAVGAELKAVLSVAFPGRRAAC
jgi:glycosyltransferase involved in cell wall biosynthesis